MRLLFTGAAPWANSGYGKPHRFLLPRLVRAGHEVALATFFGYRGATTVTQVDGEDIRLFPPARDPFFNDIIEFHAASFEADLVISLQDVWILEGWGRPRGFRWLPWMPVDTDPVSAPVKTAIETCEAPLSFSGWGKRLLREAGFGNAGHIPFGVDLDVYCSGEQGRARGAAGLPLEGFVAGMVAANSSDPSRKSFPEVLLAWQRWLERGGEGTLYLHTTITPKRKRGIDFQRLLDTMELEWSTVDDPDEGRRERARVLFPSQHRMWCGAYDDGALAEIYRSLDVLLSPSMSEGFGIPILEAQACDVPVITTNFSSMPELTFAGLCLEPAQLAWESQGGWRGVADVEGIANALGWAYAVREDAATRRHYAVRARAGAEMFGWDSIVAEHWLPLLGEMERGG